jgi:hypothetical protein
MKNPLNYASFDYSNKLFEAGIILDTEFIYTISSFDYTHEWRYSSS